MSVLPKAKLTPSSTRSVILRSGALMALLCMILTCLTHGFHPALLNFLNRASGHLLEVQIASLANGFHYEVSNNQMPIEAFLVIYFILCLLSVIPLSRLDRKALNDGVKSPLPIILCFSLIFRVILLFSVPVHESDFYRYQWDGKSSAHGINPFLYEPGALKLYEERIVTPYRDPNNGVTWNGREFKDQEIPLLKKLAELRNENPILLERVSHQAVPTIYPPVAQAVFSLSSFLFGDSLLGLKSILLVFDFLIIGVTIGILRKLNLNSAWVIIYAWSPLVLKEIANSAHYDAIPIFFTLLAIYTALGSKRQLAVASSLALGVLTKFFSVMLLPILIPLHPKNWRSYTLFTAILLLAYLPFFLWNSAGIQQVFAGLGVYNEHWQYNAGLFALIQQMVVFLTPISQSNLMPAKVIVAIVLIIIILRQSFRSGDFSAPNQDLVQRCFIVVAALFVLSPTAFPWYYIWVIPFLCIFPKRAWIMLSWLLPLSYIDFHSDIAISRTLFLNIPSLNWVIWITFALLLLADSIKIRIHKTNSVSSH